ERPGRRAGIRHHLEMDALASELAPLIFFERREHGGEAGFFELERRQLLYDRGVEGFGRALAPRAHCLRRGAVGLPRFCLAPREACQLVAAVVERADACRELGAKRREGIDRHVVLARERAECEEPLLDLLEARGVALHVAGGGFELRYRFPRLDDGALE